MKPSTLGARLRTLRAASERTVASVAMEAGLSVPYISNLENGRGNPTTTTLGRLAHAFGTKLVIDFVDPAAEAAGTDPATAATPSPSLIRLSHDPQFRRSLHVIAEHLGRAPDELSTELTDWHAKLAQILDRDLDEGDLNRLLDALVLIVAHPRNIG